MPELLAQLKEVVMSGGSNQRSNRGLSNKAILGLILPVICALGGGISYILLTAVNAPPVVVVSAVTASSFVSQTSDGDPALVMIPHPGSSAPAEKRTLPQSVIDAAKAEVIPLADPVAIAQSAQPTDPKVVEWLRIWRDDATVAENADEAVHNRLTEMLDGSPLRWDSLFKIGQAVADVSADSPTAAVFVRAAVLRADKQLQAIAPGSDEAKPILIAMNDSRRLLWAAADYYSDRDALETLATINADLVKWVSKGDPTLEDARRHGMIGVGECMFALGQVQGSIPALLALDTNGMTDNEKLGVAWIRGLALFSVGRYAQAAEQFRQVAKNPSYQYSRDASELAVYSFARQGNSVDAVEAYNVWQKRYGDDASKSLGLATIAVIAGAAPKSASMVPN
jgi:tetratricopeptide (TPR) repeat protein